MQFERSGTATPYIGQGTTRSQNTTWYDLSGDNNNGTLTNGPTFNSNGAIVFDGANDYISFTSASSLIQGQTNFTIGLTFQSDTNLVLRGLFGTLRYGCGGNIGLVSSFNNLVFYNDYGPNWPDAGTCYSVGFSNYVTSSIWIHAVATYDGTTTKVYAIKRGTLSLATGTAKTGSSNVFDYPLEIGRGGYGQYLTGKVANAFIYNRALSQQEILQNYYQAPIVTDGLVLAVDAGNLVSYESGSTTAYSLTGSLSGSLINGVKYNSNNGGHWEFDGVDDYITWGDNFDLVSSNISGFVWGKVNTLDNYTPWIDKLSGGGNYRFHSDTAGRLTLGIRASDNTYQQTSTTSVLSVDTWYNIGFTFNNSTREGKIYLNGRLIHSNTFTIDRGDTTTPLQTGYQTNNGGTLNGAVATLSLYNKALTAAEVAQNYSATKQKYLF